MKTFFDPVFAVRRLCDGTVAKPCNVLDTENNNDSIKNWRTSFQLLERFSGEKTGVTDLRMSGSGAPSAAAFQAIYDNIKELTQYRINTIIDVDLRQESHAYLNNDALNYTVQYNWINLNKSDKQIEVDQQAWITMLSKQKRAYDVLTSKQFKASDFKDGQNIPVKTLISEQELTTKIGFTYLRLNVTDHRRPNDAVVDQVVELIETLPIDSWLHFHCRGGEGRTTMFMAMYDMLKNADKITFNDIIARQASIPPYYDLSSIDGRDPKLAFYYQERYEFLQRFYHYAVDYRNGNHLPWSKWQKQHTKKFDQKSTGNLHYRS